MAPAVLSITHETDSLSHMLLYNRSDDKVKIPRQVESLWVINREIN